MNSKMVFFMMGILVNLGFIIIFSPVCTAQAHLSIKDVSVELIKIRPPVVDRTIREYRIRVILCNTGDTTSPAVSVRFQDPEGSGNLTLEPLSYSLQPNEEKTFVLENWPTILSGDVPLNISFSPISPYVSRDFTNSGYYIYLLSIGNNKTTTATPGFETVIVFIALFAFLLKKQIKKK